MSTLVTSLYHILLVLYYIFMYTFESPQFPIIYKFFRWLDKNTCPYSREIAPIVWERFTRLAAEVETTRNEKDNARVMEAKAWERERIEKRKVEKTELALRIAKDNVYKYRLALILSSTVVGVYFVFSTVLEGHGHTQLHLP